MVGEMLKASRNLREQWVTDVLNLIVQEKKILNDWEKIRWECL